MLLKNGHIAMFSKNVTISHTIAAVFKRVTKYITFTSTFMNYSDVF